MESERDAIDRVMAERTRAQVREILESGSTEGVLGDGHALVLLTTRGARSGEPRHVPVIRVEHRGSYAVIGSAAASSKHPAWYFNLKSHPEVALQDGTVVKRYLAREAEGRERREWWERAARIYPDYDVMQGQTDRRLPLFVLDPL